MSKTPSNQDKWDEITRKTKEAITKECANSLKEYFEMYSAVKSGYWCVSCRTPITYIGVGFVCNCPPPPFRMAFTYLEQ